MDSQTELLEDRLRSFIAQLQVEYGILDRMVYKNKNQHRGSSYFQYLMKVRRDLRLLQSTHLEDILSSCFIVINGNKPMQKVHLLDSLKRKKRDAGKYNFMERLLGAARLLSQMVEPMLRAATELSTLLAQSFFMGFSVTLLALLARTRVLVQQILLDIVSVFNVVSSMSQKEQSVRLNQEGIEIFRQYFPKNEEVVILECTWETDKFVLLERTNECKIETQDGDLAGDVSFAEQAIKYQSIEAFIGDDEPSLEKADASVTTEEVLSQIDSNTDSIGGSSKRKQAEDCSGDRDGSHTAASPSRENIPRGGLLVTSSFSNSLKRKSGSKNEVAFISVKRPAASGGDSKEFQAKEEASNHSVEEDPLFNLLTAGNLKDSSLC